MNGFTFNGIHSSVYNVIMKSQNRQVLPASADIFVEIPGRHGSYHIPGKLQDREISLECGYISTSIATLRSNARSVAAWLYTEERATLTFDDEPGKSYTAKYTGTIDIEQAFVMGKFTLTFRCEPFAYGSEVTTNFAGDSVTLDNAGTTETEPYFQATFTASASEWKVTLGTDYIRVVDAFTAGDTLKITTSTGAVLINDSRAMDKLDWQNSRFFALPTGSSTMTITPTAICTALIKHAPKFL
jgi:predicted phage tail component-like protein